MNVVVWSLALIAVLSVLYGLRMRQQLRHYRMRLRKLKEREDQFEPSLMDGARLDALIVSMNEAVFRLDASGRVAGANKQAKELFSMQGSTFPVSLRQVYRDADWYNALQTALQRLPQHTCLPDMNLPDDVLAPRLAALNAEHILLMCVDVSEQRRLEKQRQTFLSNLMHDLKTPLTSLLGYARSLENFGDDAGFRKEAGAVIADEAKHVNHLLDALLTLDQIEFSIRDAGASCQLADVLKQVFDMLAPACVTKDVSLICKDEALSYLLALTADELERILTNILVNAVNYAPDHSQVHIALTAEGKTCAIVIEDSGQGIPEQELTRVTERFYRVDKARTRKNGGHGLGLAIVKELIEKNGGVLALSNRASGGLCVKVNLPLVAQ